MSLLRLRKENQYKRNAKLYSLIEIENNITKFKKKTIITLGMLF